MVSQRNRDQVAWQLEVVNAVVASAVTSQGQFALHSRTIQVSLPPSAMASTFPIFQPGVGERNRTNV
jgi:hypothetical protein